jgi:hypothetical protein
LPSNLWWETKHGFDKLVHELQLLALVPQVLVVDACNGLVLTAVTERIAGLGCLVGLQVCRGWLDGGVT